MECETRFTHGTKIWRLKCGWKEIYIIQERFYKKVAIKGF
jgi:hypothetical protein